MKKQANVKPTSVRTIEAALVLLKTAKREFGVVGAVRGIAGRYPTLTRQDMLTVAKKARVNLNTASRQFNEVRTGRVAAPRLRTTKATH